MLVGIAAIRERAIIDSLAHVRGHDGMNPVFRLFCGLIILASVASSGCKQAGANKPPPQSLNGQAPPPGKTVLQIPAAAARTTNTDSNAGLVLGGETDRAGAAPLSASRSSRPSAQSIDERL